MTFTIPSLAERRACGCARVAFYAYWISIGGDLPMCLTCGLGTGNWCDTCELHGEAFEWKGQPMVGKPLCTICENDVNVVCVVCSV